MRSNEEQTRLILQKYEQHKKNNHKKAKVISLCVSLTACLMLVLGIAAVQQKQPDFSDENNDFPVGTQNQSSEDEGQAASDPQLGVYLPQIVIEPVENNVAADMIAMVIYNGRVYAGHNVWDLYTLEYNETTASLLGEYVGTGNGKITCWSDESDYEGQFASNTNYDFYTVNGYDPAFRLAAIAEFTDGTYIEFFDCLNGIWLQTGADLYEDLLHLSGNFDTVLYQLHNDWDYAKGNYKTLDNVSQNELQAFIDTLYQSEFVDLSDTEPAHSIFDGKQAHIFFRMKDGTSLGIRLFEGGYVGFPGTSARVYVYMPGQIFNTVFAATTA